VFTCIFSFKSCSLIFHIHIDALEGKAYNKDIDGLTGEEWMVAIDRLRVALRSVYGYAVAECWLEQRRRLLIALNGWCLWCAPAFNRKFAVQAPLAIIQQLKRPGQCCVP